MRPSAAVRALVFVAPVILVLLASCDKAGTAPVIAESQPDSGPPAGLVDQLPAPSALKLAQGTLSDTFHTGTDFVSGWPHQRVTSSAEGYGTYAPDFDPSGGGTEPAYAIYYFDATDFDHASTITANWATAAGDGDAWIGMADFPADSWCWHLLGESGVAHFDAAACIDNGVAYAMVVLTGTIPRMLATIHLGFARPPMISGVSPISGEAGAQVTFSALLNIPADEVSTWYWDFGGAGSPGTSSAASPTLALGPPGVSKCLVRATNAWGESDLYFLLNVNPSGSVWRIESIETVGEYYGTTSLVLEPTGDEYPHIAYSDGDDNCLGHAYYNGAAWLHEAVPGATDVEITHSSLAIDSSGELHLAYCKGSELAYACTSYGLWEQMVIDCDDSETYQQWFHAPFLVLDDAGLPHISYQIDMNYMDETGQQVCYKAYSGSAWSDRAWGAEQWNVGDMLLFEGLNPLDLNAAGLPCVPYYDSQQLPGTVFYQERGADGYWSEDPIETEVTVESMAFAIPDPDCTPQICYIVRPGMDSGEIHHAFLEGSDWHVETLPVTDDPTDWLSMALDSGGHPHICYYDYGLGELHYAVYDGSDWHTEMVDGNGNVGKRCDIALDSADNPHVSYYDQTHNCIKYACKEGS